MGFHSITPNNYHPVTHHTTNFVLFLTDESIEVMVRRPVDDVKNRKLTLSDGGLFVHVRTSPTCHPLLVRWTWAVVLVLEDGPALMNLTAVVVAVDEALHLVLLGSEDTYDEVVDGVVVEVVVGDD